MRIVDDRQTNRDWLHLPTLAVIHGLALLALVLAIAASAYTGTPIAAFTRDPTTTLGGHPLTGVLSNLGVLTWFAAAAVSLFSAAVLRHRRTDKAVLLFILFSGMFTGLLAADDMFLLHEMAEYKFPRFGEKAVYLAYGLMALMYVIGFRQAILASEYLLLLLAFVFLGLSVAVDMFQESWTSPWRIFYEDGFKLLGIANWSGYLVRTSFHALARS